MSAQRSETTTTTTGASRGSAELASERGRTTIAETVVAKIAAMAAREISGVYAMGAGMTRAIGAVRERLTGAPGSTQGVTVEVGERQAAVDLDIIAEYGVPIPDMAAGTRRNVIEAIQKLCGLEVTEVNIAVQDLHLPGEEAEEPQEARVR
ncbi:stress protein [Sphaerisporangium siamense]|uniref:Putative alkaline shock family protein YloU n=1 Tax=Sphaerisporangium siamense TaxID=795645 RepID=A0A7W7D987_9ACTN|nr:Asp23/Gls24 family envelope stress response protein [Sphaerisporangium siamense]MBB4702613.1 putative alkaline shock family protein YloU [Sphaerisporangium siamense]GII83634.1 stress protein [Sphaerisporangium siamense]